MESTLGAANRGPLRGGRRAAALEAGRPAQAGCLAAGFARAGPFGRWRVYSALSGWPPGPRWVRTWREAPGQGGLSSRQVHEPMTEGARAMRVGIALLGRRCVAIRRDSSRQGGSCAAKADLVLISWSSTGLAQRGRRGANLDVCEGRHATRQCPAGLAPSGYCPVERQLHRSTSRGRPRGAPFGVRFDPGSCSWIVEIAEVGGAAPLHHAQAY